MVGIGTDVAKVANSDQIYVTNIMGMRTIVWDMIATWRLHAQQPIDVNMYTYAFMCLPMPRAKSIWFILKSWNAFKIYLVHSKKLGRVIV